MGGARTSARTGRDCRARTGGRRGDRDDRAAWVCRTGSNRVLEPFASAPVNGLQHADPAACPQALGDLEEMVLEERGYDRQAELVTQRSSSIANASRIAFR